VIDGEASPGVEMQQVQGQDLLRSLVQHKIRNSTHSGMRKTIRAMKIGIDNARC